MRQKYLVAGIILIAVAIVGILIFSSKKCSDQNGYCIYNNIPSYLKYNSPNKKIPDNFIANRQEVLNQYFKRTASEVKTIGEAFGLDPNKYVCSNGDKIVIVDYFYYLCKGYEGMEGCGYDRKAIVCGNYYFIEQYKDSTGPVIYGPFNLE